jgi:CubicO group peptidase (beta-lactamase class C family)
VAIFSLIEEGRLSLKSPIAQWFPNMRQAENITINHLLTHTSGIVSYDNLEEKESVKFSYRSPKKILSTVKNKKLLFQPGKHYSYSNTGYLMLGIVIEQITGKSYEEAVQEYIINRINLHETDALTVKTLNKLIVRGHHHGNVLTETEHYANPFAAGAIIATPKDLIFFLQALMNGRLISQDSIQKMFTDMNLTTEIQRVYYGKGIVTAVETPIGEIIGHTGSTRGFCAALYYHPEKNIFVCVMMNDDIRSVEPAMFTLMETLIRN